MLDTFSTVEIIWTLLGILGTTVGILNLWDAVLDKRAIDQMPSVDRRRKNLTIMADASVRHEILRTSKMAVVLAIGLIAGLSRPPIPDDVKVPTWTPVGIALTAGLFYIVLVIIAQMVLDRRVRRQFYQRRDNSVKIERRGVSS